MNTDFGVIRLDPQQLWKLKTIICLVKNTQLSFQMYMSNILDIGAYLNSVKYLYINDLRRKRI